MKSHASKVFNLFAALAIFFVIALPLHEGGHSLAAQVFGVSGYIQLDWAAFTGLYTPDEWGLPLWQGIVVAFAGGGFVAVLYGLLLVCANIGKRWDADDQTAVRIILGMQLGYACGEIFLVTHDHNVFKIAAIAGMMVGLVAAVAYSFPRLKRWYNE